MSYPLCFNSEAEFETWVTISELDGSDLGSPRFSFCDYCTKKYQAEMILQDRCSYPDLLVDNDDEEIKNGN